VGDEDRLAEEAGWRLVHAQFNLMDVRTIVLSKSHRPLWLFDQNDAADVEAAVRDAIAATKALCLAKEARHRAPGPRKLRHPSRSRNLRAFMDGVRDCDILVSNRGHWTKETPSSDVKHWALVNVVSA